jgi:multiple sugar transport system permease protein
MASRLPLAVASVGPPPPAARPRAGLLEREGMLAGVFLTPTVLILGLFLAYPFFLGVWLSFSDKSVGQAATFIGLENFTAIFRSEIFRRTVGNTFVYTGFATALKLVLGMILALLMNRHFRAKRFVRAAMLLPFIVPTVLSTLAWSWMFDATFSVFNWMLRQVWALAGAQFVPIRWLGDTTLAMTSIIVVNTWRGVPFFAISILAGLQTINPELHEAAAIDGANAWQRFWRVTLPLIKPVVIVVLLFSIIVTFADFQLVYVLTRGGPANSTHLFATLAYQVGVAGSRLGEGAAISLFMFPFLLLVVILQLWYIRQEE